MLNTMVQVQFLSFEDQRQPVVVRIGELVNPFTVDSLGVNVDANPDETIDVLVHRSSGDEEIFRINPAQVEAMNHVVRRNGQWVVVG